MIRFEKLAATEKNYPFVDAVAAADYANGTFGSISSGTFTAGNTFKAIMQVEKGDDMHFDAYVVKAGEHVRVCDFSKVDGHIVNITSALLPSTVAVGNKLAPASTGKLTVQSAATTYFSVEEVTEFGVRASIVIG